MLETIRQMRRLREARGDFRIIGSDVAIGRDLDLGPWTEIGSGTKIGDGVSLGSWASIGSDCRIGDGASLGGWVRTGDNVVIEDGADVPGHVRIASGTRITADMVFEGHEFISPEGVLSHRNGPSIETTRADGSRHLEITGHAFDFPANVDADGLAEAFKWGEDDLAAFRVIPGKEVPDPDVAEDGLEP